MKDSPTANGKVPCVRREGCKYLLACDAAGYCQHNEDRSSNGRAERLDKQLRGMTDRALAIALAGLASDQALAVQSIAEDGSMLMFVQEAARRLRLHDDPPRCYACGKAECDCPNGVTFEPSGELQDEWVCMHGHQVTAAGLLKIRKLERAAQAQYKGPYCGMHWDRWDESCETCKGILAKCSAEPPTGALLEQISNWRIAWNRDCRCNCSGCAAFDLKLNNAVTKPAATPVGTTPLPVCVVCGDPLIKNSCTTFDCNAPTKTARRVGCEGDDGQLRVHDEGETCDVCAPRVDAVLRRPGETTALLCDHKGTSWCIKCGTSLRDQYDAI